MPSDFSRSVSHESEVFQSVLVVVGQGKNTSRSDAALLTSSSTLPSVSCVEPGACCVSASTSLPLPGDEHSGLDSTSVHKTLPDSLHNGLLLVSGLTPPPPPASETALKKKLLWIGRDLVISKTKASRVVLDKDTEVNKKSSFTLVCRDNSLTIQKIGYKCQVLQEHSQECECLTPRLHVYLTLDHQCSEECSLTDRLKHSIYSDKYINFSNTTEMTGKIKAKCRNRKSNSMKFSNNLIKVEPSNDDASASGKPPQAKKKRLSVANKNKQEPESELLGEAECVWLPTIMSTLSGDVEYVVLDDDAFNLGAIERPASPQSLKSKINNIFEDIDEKPDIQSIITTAPSTKPARTRMPPPPRRLSEANLPIPGVKDVVGQTGEVTPVPKPAEESNPDDPTASSLAEICTNHCPSIKDIFGDISVKEEPVEDVKQDMTVDDFSKEILKTTVIESNNRTPDSYAQKEETRDGQETEEGTNKGLFAKLIKEESNGVEEVNGDAHNSDDSLGPLQIDEKYSPVPEDAGLALAKDVMEMSMPSVNIISPFKIKILLGTPNRETHQVQVDPASQVGPSGAAMHGKVVGANNVAPAAKKTRQTIKTVTDSNPIGGQIATVGKAADTIKSLTCIYCHTSCPNAQALAEHFENHQKDGLIICYFCQKSFGDKTGMKRHMRTHTGEKPYQCKICGKRFSLPGNFKKHRDIHEDKRTEPCGVCGKTFRRKEHLKYHMRTHTGEKPFSCTECGTCFTARYSLQIHMNIHLGKKPYKCTYCSKAFTDKSTMRKHVRVHTGERPFRCQECWRCFGESGTLAAHMATHRNDRPYACDKCDLRFKTTGGLRQHEKVHTGEKQFACKFCGMKFLQKYNMTMHERIHTGEKPYTCSNCERSFRSRSCLAKHVVLHGGEDERRFGCDHCNSRFYRKAHLRRHIDMHLGIKNYECDYCKKKFCTRGTLRSHCKTFHSTGARRFPCNRCGRVFKRKVYVSTHLCANTSFKAVNRDDEKTPSEGAFDESTDSEDNNFEVKSEPEDVVGEGDGEDDDEEMQGSEIEFDILSKEVKLEWETQSNV